MRRYDPRSKSPQKSPFRPHFRMFYPDPAYVRSLRAGGPIHFLAPGKGGSPLSTPSRPTLHAPRCRGQRVQASHRPSPAGCCHPPTTELEKTERGPISTSGPLISVWHQTGRSVRQNPAFSRARHPGYGSWGRARTGARRTRADRPGAARTRWRGVEARCRSAGPPPRLQRTNRAFSQHLPWMQRKRGVELSNR